MEVGTQLLIVFLEFWRKVGMSCFSRVWIRESSKPLTTAVVTATILKLCPEYSEESILAADRTLVRKDPSLNLKKRVCRGASDSQVRCKSNYWAQSVTSFSKVYHNSMSNGVCFWRLNGHFSPGGLHPTPHLQSWGGLPSQSPEKGGISLACKKPRKHAASCPHHNNIWILTLRLPYSQHLIENVIGKRSRWCIVAPPFACFFLIPFKTGLTL